MKRIATALLFAGILPTLGVTAYAEDINTDATKVKNVQSKDFNDTQTAPAKQNDTGRGADRQGTERQAGYVEAKDKAQVDYMAAKTKCGAVTGAATSACMTEATTARTLALAEAETRWGPKAPNDPMGNKSPAEDPDSSRGGRGSGPADPTMTQ